MAIGQPHQTDRVYKYMNKLKLYNFHPFLLILKDLKHSPDRMIPDCSFPPITVRSTIHSFIDCSNIFKNAFYVFVPFFGNNGIVLNSSVCF